MLVRNGRIEVQQAKQRKAKEIKRKKMKEKKRKITKKKKLQNSYIGGTTLVYFACMLAIHLPHLLLKVFRHALSSLHDRQAYQSSLLSHKMVRRTILENNGLMILQAVFLKQFTYFLPSH